MASLVMLGSPRCAPVGSLAPRKWSRHVAARASSPSLVEPNTGVRFPVVRELWPSGSDKLRCIGAGSKTKKIGFLGVKVYACAVYVDGAKARRELGVRARGGLFDDPEGSEARASALCEALLEGAFGKALALELVRNVDGAMASGGWEIIVSQEEPAATAQGWVRCRDGLPTSAPRPRPDRSSPTRWRRL